jgi:hypothetical protein
VADLPLRELKFAFADAADKAIKRDPTSTAAQWRSASVEATILIAQSRYNHSIYCIFETSWCGVSLVHHDVSLVHHDVSLVHHGVSLVHHGVSLVHHGVSLVHHGVCLVRLLHSLIC